MRAGVRFRDGREGVQTNMQKDFRFLNTSSFSSAEQLMVKCKPAVGAAAEPGT
jgi:hypothetical protein